MSHRKAQNLEIDNLDIQILSILMKNATTPYTEIAKELIVSGGTIHVRMKKLEEMGVKKKKNCIFGDDCFCFLFAATENHYLKMKWKLKLNHITN